MKIILVMLGGFLGSICRYRLGVWLATTANFPLGTFLVNIMGCFILGWLLTFATKTKIVSDKIVVFAGTGFIGSFTTFSTFSVETIRLIESGHVLMAGLYVLASIFIGLLFTYLGWKTAMIGTKVGGEA